MFVVDTNVLVYAADESSNFHGPCWRLLEKWRIEASAWYLTWPIIYEFLRVTTHPRVFRKPWLLGSAWHFVEALIAGPALQLLKPTERHAEVAAAVFADLPHIGGNRMP